MAKVNWSAEQTATLARLYGEHVPFADIAATMGFSLLAVQSKATRMGLSGRKLPLLHTDPVFLQMRRAGKPAAVIAKAFGVSTKRVESWVAEAIKTGLVQPLRLWPPERISHLRALWASGCGPARIADIMGLTQQQVQAKARRLKLTGDRSYPAYRKPAPPRAYRQPVNVVRKPRPAVTTTLWNKTDSSRPFLDRARTECAWPLGERGDYHACCAPVEGSDTYCEHHRLIAGGLRVPGSGYSSSRPEAGRGRASVFDRGSMAA